MRGMSSLPSGATVVILLVLTACSPETSAPSSVAFDGPSRDLDEIDCDSLLTNDEIEQRLSGLVTSHGMRASSCYWFAGSDLVQLVVQSGRDISTWKSLILEDYTVEIEGSGVEVWADPDSESIGAFGPGRGLLIHGVRDRDAAIELLLLAIARL